MGSERASELRQLWCHDKQRQETFSVAKSDRRGETKAKGQATVRNERRWTYSQPRSLWARTWMASQTLGASET